MTVNLSRHPLVDNLHIATYGDMEAYFNHVSYDPSEGALIFERENEVITARFKVSCEKQLQVWVDAFHSMGIELEHVEE